MRPSARRRSAAGQFAARTHPIMTLPGLAGGWRRRSGTGAACRWTRRGTRLRQPVVPAGRLWRRRGAPAVRQGAAGTAAVRGRSPPRAAARRAWLPGTCAEPVLAIGLAPEAIGRLQAGPKPSIADGGASGIAPVEHNRGGGEHGGGIGAEQRETGPWGEQVARWRELGATDDRLPGGRRQVPGDRGLPR